MVDRVEFAVEVLVHVEQTVEKVLPCIHDEPDASGLAPFQNGMMKILTVQIGIEGWG